MAQEVTLGGDRIGSGNKQKVELHNYGMNSFNLEQDWKSSMAPGILYPFLKLVGTNHGTFDIDLDSFVRTLPTVGPLFGSYKLQLDIYNVPIRLYQGILHNNPVGIGLQMNQVYLPKLAVSHTNTKAGAEAAKVEGSNDYNYQINDSSLLKYLGLSGICRTSGPINVDKVAWRKFNAVPILAYYDIFKCYYSNKQEENAYVITPGEPTATPQHVTRYETFYMGLGDTLLNGKPNEENKYNIPIEYVTPGGQKQYLQFVNFYGIFDTENVSIKVNGLKDDVETSYTINLDTFDQEQMAGTINYWETTIEIKDFDLQTIADYDSLDSVTSIEFDFSTGTTNFYQADIELTPFKLQNIDDMRNALLSSNVLGDEFVLDTAAHNGDWTETSGSDGTGLPYSTLFQITENGIGYNAFSQNGLVVKTYQSDLFNNWLDTEFIDGENGISAITAVDTSGGSFTMDTLNLAEKVYELLNRILVSGGTYQDWQEAVYGEGAVKICETPMYVGGMSAEIMFEEVIATTENKEVDQALGSLGGKGTQVGRKGGNNIHIRCEEPCYIIGIASITPRICYSQGNDWDMTELDTLDDLHKPALDGIGFQDLMVEQMAWWDTKLNVQSGELTRNAAGKQTAWINYQTAVDKCYGDFAKQDGYAFMVLNRNYEIAENGGVKDITTYIDPAKFNYAFAYTKLDAQNFWVQIHSKVIARRKMGAQQIPNL